MNDDSKRLDLLSRVMVNGQIQVGFNSKTGRYWVDHQIGTIGWFDTSTEGLRAAIDAAMVRETGRGG